MVILPRKEVTLQQKFREQRYDSAPKTFYVEHRGESVVLDGMSHVRRRRETECTETECTDIDSEREGERQMRAEPRDVYDIENNTEEGERTLS